MENGSRNTGVTRAPPKETFRGRSICPSIDRLFSQREALPSDVSRGYGVGVAAGLEHWTWAKGSP